MRRSAAATSSARSQARVRSCRRRPRVSQKAWPRASGRRRRDRAGTWHGDDPGDDHHFDNNHRHDIIVRDGHIYAERRVADRDGDDGHAGHAAGVVQLRRKGWVELPEWRLRVGADSWRRIRAVDGACDRGGNARPRRGSSRGSQLRRWGAVVHPRARRGRLRSAVSPDCRSRHAARRTRVRAVGGVVREVGLSSRARVASGRWSPRQALRSP